MAGSESPKPKRRRKHKKPLKEDFIRVRVTSEQKESLTAFAEAKGLGVSTWMLSLALDEMNRAGEATKQAVPRR